MAFFILVFKEPKTRYKINISSCSGKFQQYENHHNIYYFDNTKDFKLYKPNNWFDNRTNDWNRIY